MAYIFRLNSEPEGTAVDLIVEDSWSPTVSYDNSDVVETISAAIEGVTDDAQAASIQALHRIQENVRYYVNEPSSRYTQETWLEWRMAGETAPTYRRRLVKALEIAFDAGMWFTCDEGNLAPRMRVTLTMRLTGWWENSETEEPDGDEITNTLMSYIECYQPVPFTPIPGDAPARLDNVHLSGVAGGGGAVHIYGAYVAFRSSKRHGTLNNFVPLWELEVGTAGTDTAPAIEAGGSPSDVANNCMKTDFTTFSILTERVTIKFNDVTANFSDNYGRYIVLYRGKINTPGTVCTVQVNTVDASSGVISPGPMIRGTAFTVQSSGWVIYDTGLIVQLPPTGTRTLVDIGEEYGFTIYASLDAGTPGTDSLYSDCLILVPIDEYMLYYNYKPKGTKTISISMPAGNYMRTSFYFSPDGDATTYNYTDPDDYVFGYDIPYVEGDGVPPGYLTRAYFIIFDGRNGSNTLSPNTAITMRYYPRYHSLQGSA